MPYDKRWRFPHACGDVPLCLCQSYRHKLFSPRVWGCTDAREGLDLNISSFPHACGDVPDETEKARENLQFSPRVWGCTAVDIVFLRRDDVFPTRVGMYRK